MIEKVGEVLMEKVREVLMERRRGELKILCSEQVCAGTECALGIKDCFAQE